MIVKFVVLGGRVYREVLVIFLYFFYIKIDNLRLEMIGIVLVVIVSRVWSWLEFYF